MSYTFYLFVTRFLKLYLHYKYIRRQEPAYDYVCNLLALRPKQHFRDRMTALWYSNDATIASSELLDLSVCISPHTVTLHFESRSILITQ